MPILDTSFMIDLLQGDIDAQRLLKLLQQGSSPLGVSSITHFELFRGVGKSRRPAEERQKVEELLSALLVFPLEAEAAKQAGILRGQFEKGGRTIGALDLLIGCTALHHGQEIVTRNAKDFRPIAGLEILEY